MARTRLFALLFLVALVGGQVLPTKFVRAQDDDGSGDDGGDGGDYDGGDGSGGDGGDLGDADAGAGDAADGSDGSDGSDVGSGWGCGWGSWSCTKDSNDWISVGLWMCSDLDPANCGCGDGGCSGADAGFALYQIMLNGWDNTCDSRGGWRPGDLHFGQTGDFGSKVGSIHYEVHPDDLWKVPQQEMVKVNLHAGDYCTGATAGGATFWAWDDNTGAPGQYSLNDYFNIKSVRPYFEQNTNADPGIGIKFVGWPGGHMGWPYDEIKCDNDEWVNNVDTGCASAIDQIWCLEPDGNGANDFFGDGVNDGIDFANNKDAPKGWIQAAGGVPLGSFMFGVYQAEDKWHCDYNWFDFCTGGNPENYCLAARFLNGNANYPQDWDQAKDNMIGETWINMGYLCDNYGQNGFCINTFDGSQDDEKDICLNGWLKDYWGNEINEWPIYVDQVWARIVTSNGVC